MVTWYDIISSRWSIHFWVKMHVYSTFFNNIIKVKLVDEMMQSNYLCVIFHVKCKKLLILTVFTLFLNLDKIQDGGQDGDHVWWRQRPPAAPPPIKYTKEEDPRLSTQGKIVAKNCNISNTQGGEAPSTPPCTMVGVWIFLYVRGSIGNQMVYSWI